MSLVRLHSVSVLLLLALSLHPSCASVNSTGSAGSTPQDAVKKEVVPDGLEADATEEPYCVNIPEQTLDSWYHDAVGYEIFVRSFYDSDGNGLGDLQGIIEKLDYLNDGDEATSTDLGISLIWLMPTSPSPSYHGYDVTDYRGVNPDYGTAKDMKELVEECHKRGIRIILDLVLNHSSSQHPWFLESQKGDSAKRDWYLWSDKQLDWPRPWGGKQNTWHQQGDDWYYGIFWSGMPDLDYTSPAVRDEMYDVARYWLDEFGVDGFRLDAVRYVVETGPDGLQDTAETLAFWEEFSTGIAAYRPDALLLGEAWVSNSVAAQYQVGGKGLHLTFDFDLMESVVAGLLAEEPADIERTLCNFAKHFPKGSGNAVFLTNHDLVRLASRLQEKDELMRLGAMLLMTLPGIPFIYYGQELGLPNGPTMDDVHKRLPMHWDDSAHAGFTVAKPWKDPSSSYALLNVASQNKDSESLLNLYRALTHLRGANVALRRGGFEPATASSKTSDALWAFLRPHSQQRIVVIVNFGATDALEAKATLPGPAAADATRIWPPATGKATIEDEWLHAGDVPAHSLVVLALEQVDDSR